MKHLLVGLIASLFLLTPALAADPSSAEGAKALSASPISLIPDCLRTNVQEADISCVSETITHFTSLLLWLIAAGAFLFVLYGGFMYATAFGDEAKTKTAKGVIKNALLGVIIATIANALISLLKQFLQVT